MYEKAAARKLAKEKEKEKEKATSTSTSTAGAATAGAAAAVTSSSSSAGKPRRYESENRTGRQTQQHHRRLAQNTVRLA